MRGSKPDRLRRGLGVVAATLCALALAALFATVNAGTATSAGGTSASPPVSPPVSGPRGPLVNEIDTIPFYAYVPCANGGAGEWLSGEIDLHVLITSTVNDNNVSGTYHYQPAGGSLVGTVTGDAYQPTGVTLSSFQGSLQNGLYTTTYVNNFRMIGPGPGNNFLVHQTDHLTINANGDVTVVHQSSSVECK